MRKRMVLLAVFALIATAGFAGFDTDTIYDATVTPIPEWVKKKINRNESPAYSSVLMLPSDTSWAHRIRGILEKDRIAWCYIDGSQDQVYILLYVKDYGRNMWFAYFRNYP